MINVSALVNLALEYCLCHLHIEYSFLRKLEAILLHTKGEISTDVLQILSQQWSRTSSSFLFPLSNTVIPFLSHFLSLWHTNSASELSSSPYYWKEPCSIPLRALQKVQEHPKEKVKSLVSLACGIPAALFISKWLIRATSLKKTGINVASKKGVNVLPFWWMACVGFEYIKQN